MILVVKKKQTKHVYKQLLENYTKKQTENYLGNVIKQLNNITKFYLFICWYTNLKLYIFIIVNMCVLLYS